MTRHAKNFKTDLPEDRVLDIKNLTFSYPNSAPLYKNFSLAVKKGEFVCLLGPSGSGKSTLFELICGNLQPNSGIISRKKTAQIYQDPYSSFHPTYSIISQIKDAVKRDLSFEEYLPLCERLALGEKLLYEKPHKLSGGELQRCSILRALLLKTELILADEPTSALDNITQLDILKHMIEMLNECGILLITHDRALAKWCADRVVRLEDL
ncbi:MAG: ATP-binding cassette domain-containing protein [Campylobacteraceae bacterium]|jgi:peptide/nickel transport system ATP-binding protein|nr:ATP-binding cassette domain-containing protein [Campylobacteraceae bacterium]